MRATSWIICITVVLLVTGCGPVVIGAGVSSATSSSSTPDTTAPQVAITSPPATPTGNSQPVIGFQIPDKDLDMVIVKLVLEPATQGTETPIPIDPIDADEGDENGFFSYTISPPLTIDGHYKFSVTAVDRSGNRSAEPNVPLEFDQTAPDAGTDGDNFKLKVSGVTQETISLSWDAVIDNVAERGVIYVATATPKNALGTAGTSPIEVELTGTSHTFDTLLPCRIYTLTLRAKDTLGNESTTATIDNRTDCGTSGFNAETFYKTGGEGAQFGGYIISSQLVAADFNEDGMTDVAIMHREGGSDPFGLDLGGSVTVRLATGIEMAGPLAGQPSFEPIADAFNYPAGFFFAEAMRSGDFNNDGILDFAIATRFSSESVTCWIGDDLDGDMRGDGTFSVTSVTDLDFDSLATSMVVMDFDRDGIQDLVLGDEAAFEPIGLLRGNGNGTFNRVGALRLNSLDGVSALEAADLDGDGLPELIASSFSVASLEIFRGSDLRLGSTGIVPTEVVVGSKPGGVAIGDFNGDRIPDLAVVAPNLNQPTGALRIMLGVDDGGDGVMDGRNGDLAFVRVQTHTTGAGPLSITAADLNSDSILDLAVAVSTDSSNENAIGNVAIFFGQGSDGVGTGRFAAPVVLPSFAGPVWVTTGDFASPGRLFGDGALDLVTVNAAIEEQVNLIGTASSTDVDSFTGTPDPTSDPFSEDDLFYVGRLVTIPPNASNGQVLRVTDYSFNGATGEVTFTVDLDGGMLPAPPFDFQISQLAVSFSILTGQGGTGKADGTFAPSPAGDLAIAFAHPFDLMARDFNGDGIIDLASLDNPTNLLDGITGLPPAKQLDDTGFLQPAVTIYHGLGGNGRANGGFAQPDSFKLPRTIPFPGNPNAGVPIDIDGDGDFDFAAGDKFTGRAESFAAGDFNLDGVLDIVVTGGAPLADPFGYLTILFGQAQDTKLTGEFLVGRNKFAPNDGLGIATGRFGRRHVDRAGLGLDLLMCGQRNFEFSELSSPTGGGVFRVEGADDPDNPLVVDVGVPTPPLSVLGTHDHRYVDAATGDFNGDTIPDVAVMNRDKVTGQVEIYLGQEQGDPIVRNPFTPGQELTTSGNQSRYAIVTGDFNGDKKLDLAVAVTDEDELFLFRGNGNGTFGTTPDVYPVGMGPVDLIATDVNQDRILDLVTANRLGGTVSVLLGNGTGTKGTGTFAAAVSYASGVFPVALAAADFNGDGVMDLAVANMGLEGIFPNANSNATIRILLGTNTGE